MSLITPSAEEVNFSIENEDWSRYMITDGTEMRIRVVVRKIFELKQPTPAGYPNMAIESMNLVSTMVPDSLRGKTTKTPFDPTSTPGTEIEFKRKDEEIWQRYTTADKLTVLVKPILVKVLKYNSYNDFGEPIYNANIQNIINVKKQ